MRRGREVNVVWATGCFAVMSISLHTAIALFGLNKIILFFFFFISIFGVLCFFFFFFWCCCVRLRDVNEGTNLNKTKIASKRFLLVHACFHFFKFLYAVLFQFLKRFVFLKEKNYFPPLFFFIILLFSFLRKYTLPLCEKQLWRLNSLGHMKYFCY